MTVLLAVRQQRAQEYEESASEGSVTNAKDADAASFLGQPQADRLGGAEVRRAQRGTLRTSGNSSPWLGRPWIRSHCPAGRRSLPAWRMALRRASHCEPPRRSPACSLAIAAMPARVLKAEARLNDGAPRIQLPT